ncbi:MAG: hypothetical protein JKY65_01660 [Planctomycetes bacterium]|nr:hypothetical protein [Planctomycetota bacterium]
MKFKDRPVEPAREVPERDDVHVASNRCPFCHEDVTPDESVACQGCLARHHRECWTESGAACSSCGSEVCLEPAQRSASAAEVESTKDRPIWVRGLGFLGLFASVAVAFRVPTDSLAQVVVVVCLGFAGLAWTQSPIGTTRAWLKFRSRGEEGE